MKALLKIVSCVILLLAFQLTICLELRAQTPQPLIHLNMDAPAGVVNNGSVPSTFIRSANTPLTDGNVPVTGGGYYALDFGVTPGNYYVEGTAPINALKNMAAFTITGWINSRSNVAGSGGNRIVSWINNGADGVDLVYQSNGSLRIGIDSWPDGSPAISSASKVPANASAPASNWVFFAVTYRAAGQVEFYFGSATADATLDITRNYNAGTTGSNIGKLAIGAFNDNTRGPQTYDRMFRGLIDNIQIHNVALSAGQIVGIQRSNDLPTPTNLNILSVGNTSAGLSWASSNNYQVVGYDIFSGSTLLGTTGSGGGIAPVTFQVVGLTPGTAYSVVVRARDATGNLSPPSNVVQLTTGSSDALEPIIHLALDEPEESPTINAGILPLSFGTARGVSNNIPNIPGNLHSRDVAETSGGLVSPGIVEQLRNMNALTLTGWLNARGSGTILSWAETTGEGVNLRLDEEGSLVLHIDQPLDSTTPAKSSYRAMMNPSTPQDNWVFFAVTYESTGQAKFYFGGNAADATLNMTATLPSGRTGIDIETLSLGYFQAPYKGSAKYATDFFNGLLDDVHLFASSLDLNGIISVQRQVGNDTEKPTPPTNLRILSESSTSAIISWTAATDNVGIAGYEILGSISNELRAATGPVTTYTLNNLLPSTSYRLKMVAIDPGFNRSDPREFTLTTGAGPTPQILLHLDEPDNVNPVNTGALSASFVRSAMIPYSTLNSRNGGAMDFDVNPGDRYLESTGIIDGLKSLSAFTITGWINNRSNIAGSGGNRIVTWINNGGDGVDLVYQGNGSLRLGVDGWPDSSPAVSSPNKVPTDYTMSLTNWLYFAVTYTSSGEVKFYFGSTTQEASLDVTRAYIAPGVTGSNIGRLAIGNFNSATRNASTWNRMFRGVIDEIQVFNSALSIADIIALQRAPEAGIGRIATAQMTGEPPRREEQEIQPYVEQNYPNPYNEETDVQIALPHSVNVARLLVHDATGRAIRSEVLTERGEFHMAISRRDMRAGLYVYSLVVDGKVIGARKMVISD
ncbi:MAG TPA: LamG-like jellyroll fold domain-containing protein [Chryseolinea sp.]|nr:LamG-like jellyroll fold domain-containing protein [Chryseolinea sp.]